MNLLITGNIGSGKSSVCRELLLRGHTTKERHYCIDDLRWKYSDGSYSGEFYAWSLMLRAAQSESRGIFEFSGVGRNAPIFKEVIRAALEAGTPWRVIHCHCHIDIIAERIVDKPADLPIPNKTDWSTNAKRMESLEYVKSQLELQRGINFWNCPELTVRTDLHSVKECADHILAWLATPSEEVQPFSNQDSGQGVPAPSDLPVAL